MKQKIIFLIIAIVIAVIFNTVFLDNATFMIRFLISTLICFIVIAALNKMIGTKK